MKQQIQCLEIHEIQDVFAKMSGKALADVMKMSTMLFLTNCWQNVVNRISRLRNLIILEMLMSN